MSSGVGELVGNKSSGCRPMGGSFRGPKELKTAINDQNHGISDGFFSMSKYCWIFFQLPSSDVAKEVENKNQDWGPLRGPLGGPRRLIWHKMIIKIMVFLVIFYVPSKTQRALNFLFRYCQMVKGRELSEKLLIKTPREPHPGYSKAL